MIKIFLLGFLITLAAFTFLPGYASAVTPTPGLTLRLEYLPPQATIHADLVSDLKVNFTCDVEGTPPYTYVWDLGDGNCSFNASVTHSYALSGYYDVTVAVTDPHGLVGTDDLRVDVHLLPTPSVPPTATPAVTPTPTPSVTPTPDYCAEPLLLADLEGLHLAQTRSHHNDGWTYRVVKADSLSAVYGEIDDTRNYFIDQSSYPSYPAALRITRNTYDVDIQAGDYLELTYDGAQTLSVYPPALDGDIDVYFFIGRDGSTYNDLELCQPAKLVPSATPTPSIPPTATPTPTPSATPSVTPSVAPSMTPNPSQTPPPTGTPTPSVYPTPEYLVITSGDYTGDGISDVAIFRPENGLWAVRGLGRIYFGHPGDIPAPGDYNGDGITDISIFRPTTGLWAVKDLTRVYFGDESDQPVPGDYDGDGVCEMAQFGQENGNWMIQGLTRIYYGATGDRPIPGDYDGDGVTDPGIFRPGIGLWAVKGITRIYYGQSGDRPVPGVYRWYGGTGQYAAGSFRTGVGIFRPTTGLWAIRNLSRYYFGGSSDTPIIGDFTGNALDDTGIFRPANGLWAVREETRVYYGARGDLPVTR